MERIVANGQRIRQMPASHGLILDSSDMVFPLYKCTMTHTDYHCVACFSIVSGLMTTQHLVDWSWKISSEKDRFYVSSCSSSHVIKLERQNELHYFLWQETLRNLWKIKVLPCHCLLTMISAKTSLSNERNKAPDTSVRYKWCLLPVHEYKYKLLSDRFHYSFTSLLNSAQKCVLNVWRTALRMSVSNHYSTFGMTRPRISTAWYWSLCAYNPPPITLLSDTYILC